MARPLRYPEAFEQIKKVKAANEKLFKTITKQIDSFIDTLKDFDVKLGKINWVLPEKLKKKIKIGPTLGLTEIPGLEASFEQAILTTGKETLPKFFQLTSIAQSIEESLKNPIIRVAADYNAELAKLEAGIGAALSSWKATQAEYERSHALYIKNCEKIEEVHEKLLPENTANKNPDQVQKLKAQYAELKINFKNLQDIAVRNLNIANETSIMFSFQMEQFLTTFEEIDKIKITRLQDILTRFKTVINSIATAKDQAGVLIETQFNAIDYAADIDKFLEIPPAPVPISAPFDAQPLSFQMTEYLPMKKSFKDLIGTKDYLVTDDFEAARPQDMSVKKDALLILVREEKVKKAKELLFIDTATNRAGYVPREKVTPAPRTARKHSVYKTTGKPCVILQSLGANCRAMDYRGNLFEAPSTDFADA